MLFSLRTKQELSRVPGAKPCCEISELSALVRVAGTIRITSGEGLSVEVRSDDASVARKVVSLVKKVFGVRAQVLIRKGTRLNKANVYFVRIPPGDGAANVLKSLGIINNEHNLVSGSPSKRIRKTCCRRAHLRGAFLGCGYVADPEKTYHLEFLEENEEHAGVLCHLLKLLGVNMRVTPHKGRFMIYTKDGERVADILRIMGADTALLNLESLRVVKGLRNQVNRLVNCETANLNKAVEAGLRQVQDIELVDRLVGIHKLPQGLQEVAYLRLKNPHVSLSELAVMLSCPVSKSGVNHRMRRLSRIAQELRHGEHEEGCGRHEHGL